jgi:predicted HTH domain antitoxin
MTKIEVPEQLLKVFAGSGSADRDVVLSAVIELIREGRVSLGRGAEVLGLSRSQLIDELGRRKVPILTLEEDGP